MGYWPSKLISILNIIGQVGWGVIASVLAGQMFSAVNGAGMSTLHPYQWRHDEAFLDREMLTLGFE